MTKREVVETVQRVGEWYELETNNPPNQHWFPVADGQKRAEKFVSVEDAREAAEDIASVHYVNVRIIKVSDEE